MALSADRDPASLDWHSIAESLDAVGYATTGPILSPATCRALAGHYPQDRHFRSHIDMARFGFGTGAYKYFSYPLPRTVAGLRKRFYRQLAPIANRWSAMTGDGAPFPGDLSRYLEACHEAGQTRPTPLLLHYSQGAYNCLHQDLYGARVFPLQATFLLSDPARDFTGGEFVVTEQRPRRQSRVDVVPLGLGDAVIFAVNQRPVRGQRGPYRVRMRHGVSRVRSGARTALGLIFHDAA